MNTIAEIDEEEADEQKNSKKELQRSRIYRKRRQKRSLSADVCRIAENRLF
jgi:hypothetical protein